MGVKDLKSSLGINDSDFNTFSTGVRELDTSTKKFRKGAKGGQGSVIKSAKGNIFEFPVFISSSVPFDYATAASSLLEQVYASYLQMAISINPVIDNKTALNGQQFSKYKSNTNKYLECVDASYQKDACYNKIVIEPTISEDGRIIEFSLMTIDDDDAYFFNEYLDYEPLSEFDHFFQEATQNTSKHTEFTDDDFKKTTKATTTYGKQTTTANNTTTGSKTTHTKGETSSRTDYTYTNNSGGNGSGNGSGRGGSKSQIDHTTTTGDKSTDRSRQTTLSTDSGWSRASGTDETETTTGPSRAEIEKMLSEIYGLDLKNEEFERIINAKDALEDDEGNSYEYQDLKTELETRKENLNRLRETCSDEWLKYEKNRLKAESELSQINQRIKEATEQDEIDRLKDEKELVKKKLNDYEKDHKQQQDKINAEIGKLRSDIAMAAKKYGIDIENLKLNKKKDAREQAKLDMEKLDTKIKLEKHKWEQQDRRAQKMSLANQSRIHAPQFMDETKIQKLNTMKPLMMTVDMNVESKNGGLYGVQYIVGVKTHNRLVDADTLPEVVEYPLKEMNKITRNAKWRAGELKFFKDILFKIKQKKQTAIDSRDPKRKWYRRLYELSHMKGDAPAAAVINGDSVIKTFFKDKLGKYGDSYGVIPNASLIISKSDVDAIKRETKIDLLKGSTGAKFCKELFMIGIIVVDIDAESIKVLLPDLHNDYEIHSIASVNKQIALLDTTGNKTKEMFKLLS